MAARYVTEGFGKGEGRGIGMMLPKRLLLQQHRKAGTRHEKRVTIQWTKPEPLPIYRRILPWINHAGQEINFGDNRPSKCRTQVKTEKSSLGNLLWTDYRFFVGTKEPTSQYSRCRACRAILVGHAERQKHLEQYKCALWLSESYRVLNLLPNALIKLGQLTKRECVSCGQVTSQSIWGIPMCDKLKPCVDTWMFDEDMPCANLTAALVRVGEVLKGTLEKARVAREQNS